jgi:tetratricopeptide (TPR) repeat protein
MDRKEHRTKALSSVFITTLEIEGEKYIVKTECSHSGRPSVSTHISRRGKTVSKRQTELSEAPKGTDRDRKIMQSMLRQHQMNIKLFSQKQLKEIRTSGEYLRELNRLIKGKDKDKALGLLEDALLLYPEDPFLLSYHGCIDAVIKKNYKSGIDTCKNAFTSLKTRVPFGEEFFLPLLYLNLGRTYLAAGRKRDAVGSFKKGLELDGGNADLLWEMRSLGKRKKPVMPIFERSNPVNKYIGMLVHKLIK